MIFMLGMTTVFHCKRFDKTGFLQSNLRDENNTLTIGYRYFDRLNNYCSTLCTFISTFASAANLNNLPNGSVKKLGS